MNNFKKHWFKNKKILAKIGQNEVAGESLIAFSINLSASGRRLPLSAKLCPLLAYSATPLFCAKLPRCP